MLFKCIRPTCQKEYESPEEEAYLCGACRLDRKRIAAEIDAQFATKVREPVVSELQAFEQNAKKFTDPNTGREIFLGRA